MTAHDLQQARAALGLTQAELAVKLRVDRVTVARWESGTREAPEFLRLAIEHLRCRGRRKH